MYLSSFLVAVVIVFRFTSSTARDCNNLSPNSACSGCPPMHRETGLPCASTTHYTGHLVTACGCNDTWAYEGYTGSPNDAYAIRNEDGLIWCHHRCGLCYEITTTGGQVEGMDPAPPAGQNITFMVADGNPEDTTEHCPRWYCQGKSILDCLESGDCQRYQNEHGFLVHFDLRSERNQVQDLGWDNVEVTYRRVPCPTTSASSWPATPSKSMWETCECFDFQWGATEQVPDCSFQCVHGECNLQGKCICYEDENGHQWEGEFCEKEYDPILAIIAGSVGGSVGALLVVGLFVILIVVVCACRKKKGDGGGGGRRNLEMSTRS